MAGTFSGAAAGIYLNETRSTQGAGFIQWKAEGTQKWNLTTIAANNDFALYNNGGINAYALTIAHATGSATFASSIQATTAKLTNLTDGYVPYHVSDASGLADSPISTDGTLVTISSSVAGIKKITMGNTSTTGATASAGYYYEVYNGSATAIAGAVTATSNSWSFGTIPANQLNVSSSGANGLGLRSTTAPIIFYQGNATASSSPEISRFLAGSLLLGYTTNAEGYKLKINGTVYFSDSLTLAPVTIDGTSYNAINGAGNVASVLYGLQSTRNANAYYTGSAINLQRPDLFGVDTASGNRLQLGRSTYITDIIIGDGTNANTSGSPTNPYIKFVSFPSGVILSTSGVLSAVQTFTVSSTITASNFILGSDFRLKNFITPLTPKELNVDYKSFEMKNEPGQLRYGAIAQEVEEKHPEFVRTDADGYKSIAYIDLLVGEIAYLKEEVKRLRT